MNNSLLVDLEMYLSSLEELLLWILEEFGLPPGLSCQQKTGTFGGFDYTEDYTTLNKTFFLKHNISSKGTVESSEVCYILKSNLYCLKGEKTDDKESGYISQYYTENTNTLQTSFGQANCIFESDHVSCSTDDPGAIAYQDGNVSVSDVLANCNVGRTGNSYCYE